VNTLATGLNSLVDKLLLKTYEAQHGERIVRVNFVDFCRQIDPDVSDRQIGMARTIIQDNGYGKFTPNSSGIPDFKINAHGIARAEQINAGVGTHIFPPPPLPPKWKFWVQHYNWAKWGAIAAWIIIPITVGGILVAIWLDNN